MLLMKKFAGVYISRDDKVLMVQEAHEEAYQLWSLPIGNVEEGESTRETAKREASEETGYIIETGDIIFKKMMSGKQIKSLSKFDKDKVELIIFHANICDGEKSSGEDILDTQWISKEDICNKLNLRGDWVREVIRIQDES